MPRDASAPEAEQILMFVPRGVLPHRRKNVRNLMRATISCRMRNGRVRVDGGFGSNPRVAAALSLLLFCNGVFLSTVSFGSTSFSKVESAMLLIAGLVLVVAGGTMCYIVGTDRIPAILALDIASQKLTCSEGHYSLVEPPASRFLYVLGRTSRVLSNTQQFVLVRTDRNIEATAFGRALCTLSGGPDIGTALRQFAPFLPAPLYVVELDWRDTPHERAERTDDPSSPEYWVELLTTTPQSPPAGVRIVQVEPQCLNCRYNLTGILAPRACPECGQVFR